ncbi:hypothetical protein HPB48_019157 [Haemaphysalis longicornis]|uniref:ATP-dependent DNA helicase n=1 Tax=Haemaphysalis longicornis TaxID=44386 RepID=A0A9J6FW36_HAELO|nr:hypothetical protein HPB48_019157 [Haemaphysalis longicornis]
MTNAEQHELLREIIHRQTTPSAPQLRVFFTGPTGCGKTFVLRLAMDLYNQHSNTATTPPGTTLSSTAQHRKGGCGSGRIHGAHGFQALYKEYRCQQGLRPQRQRVEHLPRGLPQREMRHHRRGDNHICGQPKRSPLESTPWLLRILASVPLREDGEFFLSCLNFCEKRSIGNLQ